MNVALDIPVDQLIEGCKRGEALSYKALYNQYSKAMYNTSLRIVGSTDEAEDVCQEAFVEAFRKIDSFEGRSTFGAWLKRIVVNRSLDTLKKRKLITVNWDTAHYDQAEETPEEDHSDIEWNIDMIKRAMTAMPDGYRSVLNLYLFEGYDHKEISQVLNIAESTARTQYKRAKDKLIKLIKAMA